MEIPSGLYYTRDHEWLRLEGVEATIGITDYAQGELGDIVFLDLPDVGIDVSQSMSFGVVEAVKAAADLYAPVSGEIIAVNGQLDQMPELINLSPYGDGWIIKIKMNDTNEVETLLSPEEYRELVDQAKEN